VLLHLCRPGAAPPPEVARLETRRLRLAPASRSRDFDFFMGRWKVHHRRRRDPLTGSTSWYEFDGTAAARPVWGGLANLDEVDYQGPGGWLRGVTVRLWDPKTRLWSLYWASSAGGRFEPPVVGAFAGGRGEFHGHEILGGKAVFVRFVWSEITAASCRWEQAFSDDGGRTWETNWIADFTRVE
jgi:hypothetical protein